jgi:hypothetical protein
VRLTSAAADTSPVATFLRTSRLAPLLVPALALALVTTGVGLSAAAGDRQADLDFDQTAGVPVVRDLRWTGTDLPPVIEPPIVPRYRVDPTVVRFSDDLLHSLGASGVVTASQLLAEPGLDSTGQVVVGDTPGQPTAVEWAPPAPATARPGKPVTRPAAVQIAQTLLADIGVRVHDWRLTATTGRPDRPGEVQVSVLPTFAAPLPSDTADSTFNNLGGGIWVGSGGQVSRLHLSLGSPVPDGTARVAPADAVFAAMRQAKPDAVRGGRYDHARPVGLTVFDAATTRTLVVPGWLFTSHSSKVAFAVSADADRPGFAIRTPFVNQRSR